MGAIKVIILNVALKRRLSVLSNLYNAVFLMFYGKHAISAKVTFIIYLEIE